MTSLRSVLPLILLGSILPAQGLKIDLRYDFDTSGFFQNEEARLAIETAAAFFEGLLTDQLEEINAAESGDSRNTWSARFSNPETGADEALVDLVVPEDTVIIYLGARDLGGSTAGLASKGFGLNAVQPFFDTVIARGQSGALDSPATDHGPWGGSISFDTVLPDGNPRVWSYSLTEAPGFNEGDFLGVALHEFCHIFGIGSSEVWRDLSPDNGTFFGEASRLANNGVRPSVNADGGHWDGGPPADPDPIISETFGSFGNAHGTSQSVLMDAFAFPNQPTISVLTDLDIAGLVDVGWQIALPVETMVGPTINNDPIIQIPTNTNFTYQVQRSSLSLSSFVDLGQPIAGDGSVRSITDVDAPEVSTFYRVEIMPATPAPPAAARRTSRPSRSNEMQERNSFWQSVGCCAHE